MLVSSCDTAAVACGATDAVAAGLGEAVESLEEHAAPVTAIVNIRSPAAVFFNVIGVHLI
ncbi:hypothetical protein D3C86_1979930 [compost metagenome]